ncbi:MAG: hypothetical protein EA427_01275 [Spirochaetaceae bacterium]|nr:MAG: hypothetical protein EA427_01275 [Spirochaetaceae bacterium]
MWKINRVRIPSGRLIPAGIMILLGILSTVLTVTTIAGCDAMPDLPAMIEGRWDPPVLEEVRALSEYTVGLRFSHPVEDVRLSLDPPLELDQVRWQEDMLQLTTRTALRPGAEYWLDAVVRDDSGNTASVLVNFYGLNPDLPPVLINEIVCRGSGNNPDFAELRVFGDGNLGGMTLYNGSPERWTSRKVFPEMWVAEGDYIIVHFRPQNIPEEVDETEDMSASGGLRSHPEAWDLWVWEGTGLPTTSGGLTLTEFPHGPIMDAILYSERTYDSACPRRGFGTAAQLQIFEDVVARGGWKIAGDFVVPDDGVDPSSSTATRSINRDRAGTDTDTREDWHIVPTRGATPGTENSEERYEP